MVTIKYLFLKAFFAVTNGERLPKPKNCPDELHELMKRCWVVNMNTRPTFVQILEKLRVVRKEVSIEQEGEQGTRVAI